MKRFFLMLKSVFVRLFHDFLKARLQAECPDADKRIHRRLEYDSDDPRSDSDPPQIGIL
jgi:hypothetical protein